MGFLLMTLEAHVYFDKANYKIRAEVVDRDSVHVNEYHPETGIMKYYRENKKR